MKDNDIDIKATVLHAVYVGGSLKMHSPLFSVGTL